TDPSWWIRNETHDRQRRHTLAATGFANDTQRLSRSHLECNVVEHPRQPIAGGELQREALDTQQIRGGHRRSLSLGLRASFRPSPIRLTARTVRKIMSPG